MSVEDAKIDSEEKEVIISKLTDDPGPRAPGPGQAWGHGPVELERVPGPGFGPRKHTARPPALPVTAYPYLRYQNRSRIYVPLKRSDGGAKWQNPSDRKRVLSLLVILAIYRHREV